MTLENTLLEVAQISILNSFNSSFTIDKQSLTKKFPLLLEKRASFVTLNLEGKLRGCVGSLVAHKDLLHDVIENAKKSAFSDPRFSQLSYKEFQNITIEISVLTPAVLLHYTNRADLKEKIKPFEHGIILQCENKQATFLPQVWEQIPNFEDFFTHLSKKAGFETSCLDKHPTLYLYTATKIK